MKSIYNVPQVRTQQTTALTNIGQLLDVQVTGVQNNDILVYNSPKWINKPQVLNNNQDVLINAPAANESLVYNGLKWANKELGLNDMSDVIFSGLPSINQVLTYDGDYWTNQTPANANFSTLLDVDVSTVQTNDNIIYNGTKYVNKKKYSQFDFFVQLSNTTVTGAIRTIYFCNLATINLPASTAGEQIKIINTNGPLCTFAYTGLIYHISNNFNTSFSTVDACEMILEGIIGGNWQIVSFTGRWLNASTNKYISNNNLEDLRNMAISAATAGQYLRYNGTNWTNNTISGFLTSFNGRTGPAISPVANDYAFTQINGISLTGPVNGQYLTFNGTNWINSTLPSFLTSFNGRTGPSINPVANDYAFTQINGISLTGPVNGQYLQFNGTNWINVNLPNQQQFFTSGGNLSNNQFQLNGGQNGNYNFAFYAASRTMSFKFMTIVLTANVGGATSRVFSIFKNGIATTDIMTFIAASGTVQRIAVTSSFGLNDTYAIFHTTVGGPANSAAAITIEYV